ncbi:MAG: family 16 glycoside hydrolase [Bdellovibrionota bacterium]
MASQRLVKAPYSWAVQKGPSFSAGELEVAFNVIAGKEDPEAGIIWGFQDGTNYYYVRTNAVEDNIIFYRMNHGKKEHLKDVEAKTPFGTWHKLKIQIEGRELTVYLDGKIALNTKNKEAFPPGKVGFFTSADTECAFDDWKVTPTK